MPSWAGVNRPSQPANLLGLKLVHSRSTCCQHRARLLLAKLQPPGSRFLFLGWEGNRLRSCAIGVLQPVKHPVEPALGKQFLVRASFSYLAMVKHDDLIRSLYG